MATEHPLEYPDWWEDFYPSAPDDDLTPADDGAPDPPPPADDGEDEPEATEAQTPDAATDVAPPTSPAVPAARTDPDLAPWLPPALPAPPGLTHAPPRLRPAGARRTKHLALPEADRRRQLSPTQRLLLLDSWQRSGLPAKDFAALVGISKHTLYLWKKRFAERGPAGLEDGPRGTRRGSRLPELTRRAILMIKEAQPDAGCQRIADLLARGPALPASPTAIARVLKEAGYETVDVPTRPNPAPPRRFERARPNQLWQTDLFSFVLKRQNRRVYLVAFLDDHSRYITAWNLHGSQSTTLVLDALRDGLGNYPPPQEILTDNGSQYVTWRGTSVFQKELRKRGIAHVLARPRHPETLGKTERFWGTLWRECLEAAVFVDLDDARIRLGHFIDYYNFRRPHRGIDGLVPADRFFASGDAVRRTIEARVAANALELARHGVPKRPFYFAGQTGDGKPFSVHAQGERLILIGADGARQELDPDAGEGAMGPPDTPEAAEPAPGTSALDASLQQLAEAFGAERPHPRPAPPDGDDAFDAGAADAEVTHG